MSNNLGVICFVFVAVVVGASMAHNYTYHWTVPKTAPKDRPWQAVSCDYEGVHCVMSQYRGGYNNWGASQNFFSNDGGDSWKESSPSNLAFLKIVSSRTGQWFLTTDGYFSSDFGASFSLIDTLPNGALRVAMIEDATTLYVVDNSTECTVRKAAGSPGAWTWSEVTSLPAAGGSRSISCSSNGQYVYVAESAGALYFSSNYAETWTLSTSLLAENYVLISLATSLNGAVTYVVAYSRKYGGVFPLVTYDYGASWNYTQFPAALEISSIATNEDGSVVAISEDAPNGLLISNDYGSNWNFAEGAKNNEGIVSVTVNADGSHIVAAAGAGDNYYDQYSVFVGKGLEISGK